MRHSWTISLVLLAIAGFGILGAGPGAERYSITDLGALPDETYSAAYGINAGGQVVGATVDCDDHYCDRLAFLWDPTSGIEALPVFGPDPYWASAAYRINDAGWIVGEADGGDDDGYVRAVIWHDGGIINLGTLSDHNHSQGRGINNLGQAVGWSWYASTRAVIGPPHAFLWDDGVMIGLGALEPNEASQAFGINDYTQVVGWSSTTSSGWHAFLWEDGGMIDLGTLGTDSVAYDINNNGDVVGWSEPSENDRRACAWIDGALIDLGPDTAYAINDLAQIVGAAGGRAALWEETSPGQWESVDLNDRLPSGSAWTLYTARDINDRGQIVGWGESPSGYTRGYLLTPILSDCPNPGTSGNYCLADCYPNTGDGIWDYAVDGDCIVDMSDLGQLLPNYGTTTGMTREDGDVYPPGVGDGAVDMSDLGELLAQYGDDCN